MSNENPGQAHANYFHSGNTKKSKNISKITDKSNLPLIESFHIFKSQHFSNFNIILCFHNSLSIELIGK